MVIIVLVTRRSMDDSPSFRGQTFAARAAIPAQRTAIHFRVSLYERLKSPKPLAPA